MFVEIDEFLIGAICDDIELCEEIEYPVYSTFIHHRCVKNFLK